MAIFPTNFVDQATALTVGLDERGDAAVRTLAMRGYEVVAGLTKEASQDLTRLAQEPHIKEYCPNDYSNQRFADAESTKKWLAVGRGVFLLIKKDNQEVAGYSWVGAKKTEEVPGGETTFALRLGEAGLGQGLSEPFSIATLAGAAKLFGANKVWLETWESNSAAVHVYEKLGFKLVNKKSARRARADGEETSDTRLFMKAF